MVTIVCPGRQTLLQYSLGTLSDEERDALDSHLDGCPDCQAMIMTLDDANDTVIGSLRTPLRGESVLAEPELQEALAAAMAMPGLVGSAVRTSIPAVRTADPTPDMPKMLGEYRLLEELGRGGMGRVYKALHTKLDRIVAVKILPRGRVGDQKAIARFEREMKAVGRLAHSNIVQAHDAREIDGTPVLIMEFVDGLDLAKVVRHVGPAPTAEACELMRQTALALQCAHEHGLVHRDIKPSNIMLSRSGEVKLLDLGLARFYDEETRGAACPSAVQAAQALTPGPSPACGRGEMLSEMTGTGQAMGTADYMAPEQAADSRSVDIRADLYSLGCTLYKLLSGRAPFGGPEHRDTLDKLNAHVATPIPFIRRLVPSVPERLAAILDRLLAKDPNDRFSTPAEVADALAPWCVGADLPALAQQAIEARRYPLSLGESSPVGQAVPDTALPLLLTSWGRKWFAGQLMLLLVAGAIGFAFGIMIHIQKDGQETTVEVPDGSHAHISPDGQVNVMLPGQTSHRVPPAPNEKAILGTWEVVRSAFSLVRPLSYDKEVPHDQAMKTTKVVITADTLRIVGPDVTDFAFQYKLNPSSQPGMIDLQTPGTTFGLVSYGIYELSGNELKICTSGLRCLGERGETGYEPPNAKTLRPSEFWAELGSDKELLVLRRMADATVAEEDEKAIQGTWQVEEASPAAAFLSLEANRQVTFSGQAFQVIYSLPDNEFPKAKMITGYALDPTAKPKRIDFANAMNPTPEPLHGIYQLAGDRFTIALNISTTPTILEAGSCPPSEFTKGPNTTVVVLKRVTEASKNAVDNDQEDATGKSEESSAGQTSLPDDEAIQGAWEIVKSEDPIRFFACVGATPGATDVQTDPGTEDVRSTTGVLVANGKITFSGKHIDTWIHKYQIDSTTSPKQIDLETNPPHTLIGIYELTGDELTICARFRDFQAGAVNARPTDFHVDLGADESLLVLRRVRAATDPGVSNETNADRRPEGTVLDAEKPGDVAAVTPADKPTGTVEQRQAFIVGNSPYYKALTDMAKRKGMVVIKSFNTQYDELLPLAKGHLLIVETHNGVPTALVSVLDKFFPGAAEGLKSPQGAVNVGDTKIVFTDFSHLLDDAIVDSPGGSEKRECFIVGNSPYWETLTDLAKRKGMTVTKSFNTKYDELLPMATGHLLLIETHDGVPTVSPAILDRFYPNASDGLKTPDGVATVGATRIIFVDFSRLLD